MLEDFDCSSSSPGVVQKGGEGGLRGTRLTKKGHDLHHELQCGKRTGLDEELREQEEDEDQAVDEADGVENHFGSWTLGVACARKFGDRLP